MKNLFIIALTLLTFNETSFGQDSTIYIAKARLFLSPRKYTCTELILRNDSTYHYEEISGDLCLDIVDGKYEIRSDTICLLRKDEFPTIKYIYKKNKLVSITEYKLGLKEK